MLIQIEPFQGGNKAVEIRFIWDGIPLRLILTKEEYLQLKEALGTHELRG